MCSTEIEYFRLYEIGGRDYILLVNHTLKIYAMLEPKYASTEYTAKCLGLNLYDLKRFDNLKAFKKVYKNYK